MFLRLSGNCDISCNKDYWFIFHHNALKLCKIKRTKSNEKIFQNLIENRFIKYLDFESEDINTLLNNGFITIENNIDCNNSGYSRRENLFLRYFYEKNKGITIDEYYNLIRNANITIIGCGAIGSYLAMMLSAIKVGKLTLIDGDVVDESNLMRQLFFGFEDINKSKVFSLKKKILNNSKETIVNTIDKFIDVSNYNKILNSTDLIIQTADTPKIILDLIVEKWASVNKIPVLFTHRNTIGPLYVPGYSVGYSYFIKELNKQTNGVYFDFLKTLDFNSTNNYPAIPHGPLIIIHYLYEEILSFITKYKKIRMLNKIVRVGQNGIEEIMSYHELSNSIKK